MFNKKLTLAITGTAFALGSLGALAAPAGAHHQHYITTPQGNQVTLPCEPAGTGAAEVHPRHTHLHMSPAQADRAITVASYGAGTCSAPRPNGPVAP